ncbi:MAG: hypothetical protein R8K53_00325 [Mariprofundaceae bacterium]
MRIVTWVKYSIMKSGRILAWLVMLGIHNMRGFALTSKYAAGSKQIEGKCAAANLQLENVLEKQDSEEMN